MEREENINWEKLLRHIEGNEEEGEELTQEELEMLLLSDELNMRLQEENPKLRFPVQQGWTELQQRYDEKTSRLKRFKLYRVLAVAAVLLMLSAPAWWFFSWNGESAGAVADDQVQLTIGNGKTINLDSGHLAILQSEGAALNGTNLVYQQETGLPAAGQELRSNVLSVPNGKYTRIVLGDGTVIWLNSGSKLSYPVPFAAAVREVSLEGEAYFDVSHNAARPFVVHLKDLKVRVLGTSFNINTFGQGVQTALEHGKVSLEAGSQSLLLNPGEVGSFESGRLHKSAADLRLYTAWKDQDVYFHNNTLDEIADRLSREYNLNFVFEQEALKDLHFTIDMPKPADVNKILNNIRVSTDQVDFVTKGNKIEVKQR